jgi:hypothetical protein
LKKATDLLSQINNLQNEIHYSEIDLNNRKAIDSLEMDMDHLLKLWTAITIVVAGPIK